MGVHHYPADAWGGVQADSYGAHVVAPSSSLAPPGAELIQTPWDETVEIYDERFCQTTSSKTNAQCRAYPKRDTPYCVFHQPKTE